MGVSASKEFMVCHRESCGMQRTHTDTVGGCCEPEGVVREMDLDLGQFNSAYDGETQNGKPHGLGTMIWTDDDDNFVRIYKGSWVDGEACGEGHMGYSDGSRFNGFWNQGKAEGKGIMTYPDGSAYEGDWFDNKYHGVGKLTLSDGTVYVGDWKNGEKNGTGTIKWGDTGNVYEGDWQDNTYNGKGTKTYADGSVYRGDWRDGKSHGKGIYTETDVCAELYGGAQQCCQYIGDWKDGKRHGKGTYTYPDGSKYKGDWQNGKIHGNGTYTYPDGSKYEGDYQDDKRRGKGTWTHPDGNKYEGDWQDDKRHGKGTWTHPDGSKYEGFWQDNKRHGKGAETCKNVLRYEGDWKDNKRHGKGTMIHPDGCKYEGDWKDDKWHGKGISTEPDGSRYEGDFQDDKYHGKGTMIYHGKGTMVCTDGTKYEGDWKEGMKHGKGIMIDADGYTFSGQFVDGRKHNGICHWPTGQTYIGPLDENDCMHGKGVMYYEDRSKYHGGWYHGVQNGECKKTYPNGDTYEGAVRYGKYHGRGKYICHDFTYEGEWIEDEKQGMGTIKYADGSSYRGMFKQDMYDGRGVLSYPNGGSFEGEFRHNQCFDVVATSIIDGQKFKARLTDDLFQQPDAKVVFEKVGREKSFCLFVAYKKRLAPRCFMNGLTNAFKAWKVHARAQRFVAKRRVEHLRKALNNFKNMPGFMLNCHLRDEERRVQKLKQSAVKRPPSPVDDTPSTPPAYLKTKTRKSKRRDYRTPRQIPAPKPPQDPWCKQLETDLDLRRQTRKAKIDRLLKQKQDDAPPFHAQGLVDLHGYDRDEAREKLRAKILTLDVSKKTFHLEVITGKGLHSAKGGATVKSEVVKCLVAWKCKYFERPLCDGFNVSVTKGSKSKAKKALENAKGLRPMVIVQ